MNAILRYILILILASTLYLSGSCQNPDKALLIDQLADSLSRLYVFEDKGIVMAEMIQSNYASGKYDALTGEILANQLQEDLRRIVDDKHLNIFFGQPQRQMKSRNIPNYSHSISEAAILNGNIGYLEITGFRNPDDALKNYLAMQLNRIKRVKAIIIDLRNNGGGSPEGVRQLSSYFFKNDTTILLNTIEYRGYNVKYDFYVLSELEAERILNTPIYLLISGYTFSAGEGFAYLLQTHKKATLVGETTGGGAHPVNFYPLENGIVAKIPIGRAINPITGTNWEGVGVIPDIEIEEDLALKKTIELINRKD